MSEKEIQQVIAQALNRAAEKNQPVILAQAFAFDAQDILAVLTHPADQQTTRIYWEQPSEGFAMAGLNSVLEINPENGEKLSELTGRMCAVLDDVFSDADSTGSRLRFLGGTAFDLKAETDSVWQDFPRMRFVIPECLVIKENQDTQLIISRLVHPGDNPDRILKEFSQTCIYYQNRLPVTLPNISRVGILEQENTPDRATYERKIYSILSELKPGNLEKVVLSRSTCLKLEGHFRITSAMQILRAAYHECTNFFFSFPDEGIFFGSTPERLISKHGNEIKTEALAGTMGRGRNMEEDRQLAEQLMASHKEMEEHMYVVDQIRQRLEPFLTNFEAQPKPEVLRLKNVQHLRTRISGLLKDSENILELVERLHPTPAVAGTPRERAVELIRDLEDHDRGWYSGPVGWMDRDGNGEFMVALRSALVKNNQAHVFAGGGIVSESLPEKEWEETELKMKAMISALSGGEI